MGRRPRRQLLIGRRMDARGRLDLDVEQLRQLRQYDCGQLRLCASSRLGLAVVDDTIGMRLRMIVAKRGDDVAVHRLRIMTVPMLMQVNALQRREQAEAQKGWQEAQRHGISLPHHVGVRELANGKKTTLS